MKILLPGFAKAVLCTEHVFIKCTCGTFSVLETTQPFLVLQRLPWPGPGVSHLNPVFPPTPKLPSHLSSRISDLEGACGQPNNEAEAPGDRRDLSVLGAFHCYQCFWCPMLAPSRGWVVGSEGKRPSYITWQARCGQRRKHPLGRLAGCCSGNRFSLYLP